MTTAVQKRRNKAKVKKLQVIPAPWIDTLSGGDLEIKKFVLEIAAGAPDLAVDELIIDGEINVDMVSPELSVTIHDQARELIKSDALWDDQGELTAIDVFVDGNWWRLIRCDKQVDDLLLTLELRQVVRMRDKKGPRKAASRAHVTRAQYVLSLVLSGKSGRHTKYYIPELKKKIAIAKLTAAQRKKAAKGDPGNGGFDDGLKIPGVKDSQLRNITVFMEEADKLNASVRPVMAGLVAGFGESGWSKAAAEQVYGTHKGVFQSDQIPPSHLREQSHYFLVGGRSFLAGGAIKYAKDHQYATLGEIAEKTEISDGSAAYYNTFRGKAKRIYDAWHGGTGSGSSTTLYKRYEFKVDKKESYWDAVQRMANEVHWRAYFSGDTFYYLSEERLYSAPARYRVAEGDPGIINIDFSQDYRKPIATARVTARLDRWEAPPGTVVIVDGLNGKGSHRWLVESIRRSLFSADAEINLKRKMNALKEPRSETQTSSSTNTRDGKRGHITGDTAGLTDDMVRFLQEIAGETDEEINVVAGKQSGHAPNSTHHSGNGADIEVGGDARASKRASRKGDMIAIAAMVVCGVSRKEARRRIGGPYTSFQKDLEWNGYQIEMGWKTEEGGNHFNHVHVGLDNWQEMQNSDGSRTPKPPAREVYSAHHPERKNPPKDTSRANP